jgi:hypothetical protein
VTPGEGIGIIERMYMRYILLAFVSSLLFHTPSPRGFSLDASSNFILFVTMTSFASEKAKVENVKSIESRNSARINECLNAFTPEEKKKIIRKVDFRLIPTLGFMYCVSLMDRTNLGVAMVAGMGVDLNLTSQRYSLIVLLFFITYVALQPPATVILRKVGPRLFLPLIVVLWGVVMISFGFVKVWHTLLPLRLLLGIFEAGFFPGKFGGLFIVSKANRT